MEKQVNTQDLDFSKTVVANEYYPHYCGTESHYKYGRYLLTDGTNDIAKETQSFWLLDMIISHQHSIKDQSFQSWNLVREMEVSDDGEVQHRNNVFNLVCDDGNGNVLKRQKVPFFSDFEFDKYNLWLIEGVILLPKEW